MVSISLNMSSSLRDATEYGYQGRDSTEYGTVMVIYGDHLVVMYWGFSTSSLETYLNRKVLMCYQVLTAAKCDDGPWILTARKSRRSVKLCNESVRVLWNVFCSTMFSL